MTGLDPAWRTLATGLAIAAVAMTLTHPLAIVTTALLAILYARTAGLPERTPMLMKAAGGLALAVLIFNALFSWSGSTALWQAPFRLTWLGRPRLTLEAIAWGAAAGLQLGATVLALGTATLAVPPETLHRAMERVGLPRSLATAGGLALRLVPDTTRDAEAMGQALRTRGVETGGLRGASRTLVPLTARSLDRAMVAEETLLARGFGPERPTARRGRWWAGWLALAGWALALSAALIGPGRPDYYAGLAMPVAPASLAWLAAALLVPGWLLLGVARCSR